jgi:Ca2+-binding RTX toxin-like protein
LVFRPGIRPQDIEVTVAMPDYMAGPVTTLDITLKVRHTDREILLRDYPLVVKEDSEVDGIWFDDRSYWSRDDLLSLVNLPNMGPYAPRMPWHDGINLMGGGGNDRIEGEDGHDWLRGSYGRDTLVGGAGNDTMSGGDGNDTYDVDSPADIVYEQEGPGTGKDVIWASCDYIVPTNVETIVLTGKKDVQAQGRASLGTGLIGNDGNNVLVGGTGRDTLNGAFGNDTLFGGEGSDYYYAIDEGDVIVEPDNANDFDVLASMTDHVTMADHIEAVFLKTDSAYAADGNAQENWMYGRASGSWFDGKAGDDHLFGSTGEDVLIGGEGDDELLGDAGNDLYVHRAGDGFDTLRDTDKTGPNVDTLNWEGVTKEKLWFSRAGNDLKVQVLGSTEGVLIQDWYLGAPFQIERQTVGTLTLTNGRVDALVQAMASVAMPSTSLTSLAPAQQLVILQTMSTAWQG